MSSDKVSVIAGVLAGIAVFLVLHQLWIMPIWFILPNRAVIAAAGGLAVGGVQRAATACRATLVDICLGCADQSHPDPSIILALLNPPLFTQPES